MTKENDLIMSINHDYTFEDGSIMRFVIYKHRNEKVRVDRFDHLKRTFDSYEEAVKAIETFCED